MPVNNNRPDVDNDNNSKGKSRKDTLQPSAKRRDVLRAVGGGVVGLSGVRLITGKARADDLVKLPKYKQGNKVLVWMEKSRAWYNYTLSSIAAADQIGRAFRSKSGVIGFERTRDKTTDIDGHMGQKISILVDETFKSNRHEIPHHVDSIPVEVNQTVVNNTAYKQDYDPVIGGVTMNRPGYSEASFTCAVTHDNVTHMMSARHAFIDSPDIDRCQGNDIRGVDVQQNGDFIGKVKHHWLRHDIAINERNPYFGKRNSFGSGIVGESGEVIGHVSQSQLENLKTTHGRTVHKRGIANGYQTGEINGTGGTLWCGNGNFQDRMFRCTALQGFGDSGGPVYDKYEFSGGDALLIIGPATQQKDNYDSTGAAAWWINDQTGVEFGA